MSGYCTLFFSCFICGRMATGNPDRVVSIRARRVPAENGGSRIVADPEATRQAVCRPCAERMNEIRIEHGVEPFPIPDDAYEAAEVAGI